MSIFEMTYREVKIIFPILLFAALFVGGVLLAACVFLSRRWERFRRFWQKRGVLF